MTERIYARTREIVAYRTLDHADIDIDRIGECQIGATTVSVIDPLADYTAVMRELFDFNALSGLFGRGFRMIFDGMHGVTGPYAHHILEACLGAPDGTVIRGIPLQDFGGQDPDPNLHHAAELVSGMRAPDAPELGAACDGDGDRNLILGRDFYVTPGDSVAVLASTRAPASRDTVTDSAAWPARCPRAPPWTGLREAWGSPAMRLPRDGSSLGA